MVEWVGTGRADQHPTSQHLLSTNPTCFEQRGIAQRKTPTPKMDTVLFPVDLNLWFFPGQLNRCGDVGEVQSTVGDRKRVEFVELNNLSTIELLSTVENTLVPV